MAAAVSRYEAGLLSGLFLTEPHTGWILYRASSADEPDRIDFDDFERMYRFRDPRGMAFADPLLYVYEAETQTIWSLDILGRETPNGRKTKRKAHLHGRILEHPSHMAVSPHGLLAVIVDGEIIFLQKDLRPIHYERSRFAEPIDMRFSAWNTLRVLDRERNALVSITFSLLKDGDIIFESEAELPTPEPEGGQRWEAMGIYEGLVYLADQTTIFVYLESDRRLIPIASHPGDHGEFSQLALTYENLYLLEEDFVDRHPRAQPADLTLEGGPHESQRALLAFYPYLEDWDLLPTRRVLARRSYQHLQDLLVKEGVLLLPTTGFSNSSGGKVTKKAWRPFKKKQSVADEEKDFMDLLCGLNQGFCRASRVALPDWQPSLDMPVPQGEHLVVPRVELTSRLGRDRIELDGRPIQWHVNQLVVSAELMSKVDPALLLSLNRGWREQDVTIQQEGPATVPVEYWTAMVAVPAAEFDNQNSELWLFPSRYDGVGLFGREGYTEQASRSLDLQPEDTLESDACETLKKEHRRWLSTIYYPLDQDSDQLLCPDLHQKAVRLGILEFSTTVKRRHDAFCQDRDHPTWYEADDLEVVAKPAPASFQDVSPSVTDISTFSTQAHHGTHVAAIVGGRPTACWSGLLPRAQIFLVDLTDTGSVRRSIVDAKDVDTKVFNVSQEFSGGQSDLHRTIDELDDRVLFVVAAGNAGKNLNDLDAAEVPAPARWGQARNVVTVTAGDWDRNILTQVQTPAGTQSGANYGKRYVDLLAPGKDIYSASEPPRKYGPATGTSQAAPQVAAAGAMLIDHLVLRMRPGDVKARLIATADWKPTYTDMVWGGHINFGAAVRHPDRTLIRTTTGEDLGGRLYWLVRGNDPWIKITNAPNYYERTGQGETAPRRIRLRDILSLKQHDDGSFRVVLRERQTDHLKILLDARLDSEKRILCDRFDVFDQDELRFRPDGQCDAGLQITQIEEYILGGNYNIRWKEEE